MNSDKHLKEFTAACFEALEFTELGDEGQPPADTALINSSRLDLEADCRSFWHRFGCFVLEDNPRRGDWSKAAQAGHDFWLTRNGHGCGFWEPGDWPINGKILDLAAKHYGEFQPVFVSDELADDCDTETEKTPAPSIDFYVGKDGVPVVHIDTPEWRENANGPVCRVYLNDGEIWQNPPLAEKQGRFNVTFEIMTPESAEYGEPESRGFIAQNITLREAVGLVGGCAHEADTAPLSLSNAPRWFTNAEYGHGTREYFETGREESRSLHLPADITPSSALRIARLLGVRIDGDN